MPLLTAPSAFGLGRRRWSCPHTVVSVHFVHKVLITIDNIRNVFLKRNVNEMKQRHRNTQGQHTCTTGYLTDSKLIVTYLVFWKCTFAVHDASFLYWSLQGIKSRKKKLEHSHMILTYCLTRITPDHCDHHFDCLLVMLAESNDAVLLRLWVYWVFLLLFCPLPYCHHVVSKYYYHTTLTLC